MAYNDVAGFSGYSRPRAPAAPTTPTFDMSQFTINVPQLATGAAQSNLAASPYNVQLADIINATNRAAQQAANAARLGPGGEQVQANILGNLQRTSAGLLDPATEAMLQSGIAQSYGGRGFGVDSPALASAYRRALGKTLEETQAGAAKQYEDLLAVNPAAPVYNAGELVMSPQTYTGAAEEQARLNLETARIAEQSRQNALQRQLAYDQLAQETGLKSRDQQLREQEFAWNQYVQEQNWWRAKQAAEAQKPKVSFTGSWPDENIGWRKSNLPNWSYSFHPTF